MNKIRIPVIIACLFLSITPLAAQTVVSLSPVAKQQFFSATGVPLASGCVNTYTTGTSTPLQTFTDSTGATPNPNPIILDAGGFANVWLSNASYRFVVVAYDGIPGNKCAAGVTQYTIDGINAFAAISTGSNLFLLGQNSDPAGTAGEMVYRTDIPCFRFFTTFWDCVVRLTDTQTLTNKTLASPILTGTTTGLVTTNANLTTPTINGVSVPGPPATFISLLNSGTGTTINTLTKLVPTGANMSGIITTAGDLGGAVGICIANCGAAGNATIQQGGVAACIFDGPPAVFADDYVTISATTNGQCHDAGATYPTGTQVIGRITVTTGVNPINVMLFGPEIKQTGTQVSINLSAQGANITSTPLFTPTSNGFYRFSCYIVVTQAATVSSTSPNCNVLYTDADSSVSETIQLTTNSSANTVGAITAPVTPASFFAKSGVAISYSTTGYATNGATSMQYALHLKLEGPF